MLTNPKSRWGLRLATFVAWALAAASVAYWVFKLGAPPPGPMAAVVSSAAAAQVDSLKVARLLGATDAPVTASAPVASASSRFSLVGVVAGASRTGTALIAVDGKPARPYRVGAAVDTGYVLQSVGPRTAMLAPSVDAPAVITLEMAAPRPAGAPAGAPPPVRYAAPPAPYVPPPAPPTAPNAPGMSGPASSPSADARRRLRLPATVRAASTTQIQ